MLKDASLERPAKNDAPQLVNSVVQRMPSYNRFTTIGDVRVPVILVQYQNVKFKSADPVAQYTDYLNKEGYNGYHNIGSVRDYFIQNSNGLFRPTFDVYGPVTLSKARSGYDARGGDAMKEAQSLLNWVRLKRLKWIFERNLVGFLFLFVNVYLFFLQTCFTD